MRWRNGLISAFGALAATAASVSAQDVSQCVLQCARTAALNTECGSIAYVHRLSVQWSNPHAERRFAVMIDVFAPVRRFRPRL
jgi:methylase of polypeptide subunit release factors